MTRHEYDDGLLVASVTTTEPEYSPLDYAEMQALAIYEASLCPGCSRPIDICATDYKAERAFVVDTHICMASRSRAVQERIDDWKNAPQGKRSDAAPLAARHSDGLMYAPRLATPDELTE